MPSFEAELRTDLEELQGRLEKAQKKRSPEEEDGQSFYPRVETDFGATSKSDVMVQTRQYNFFLYRDGGVGHGDFEDINPEEDSVLTEIERSYAVPDSGNYFWREN